MAAQKSGIRAASIWGPVPAPPQGWTWSSLMDEALVFARRSSVMAEVPVGAVIVDDHGHILAGAGNETRSLNDASAHAEILALRKAGAARGDPRLPGAVMVVTLEPCLMCAGAIREAGIKGLVYGAEDAKAGAVVSRLETMDMDLGTPSPWHMGGIKSEECAELLRNFFAGLR